MSNRKGMSLIERAKPGDKLKSLLNAETINAFKDAAIRSQRGDSTGSRTEVPYSSGIIKVKNTTGAALDRFSVVGVGAVIYTPTDNLQEFKNAFGFSVTTPTTASHAGKFAILQETLDAGKIGSAIIAGVTPCKIYVDDEDDTWVDVKDGDATQLTSAAQGAAQILWKESGEEAAKWAVIRFMPKGGEEQPNIIRIQITSGVSAGSATAIHIDETGTDIEDMEDLIVYDPFTLFNGQPDGAKGYAVWIPGYDSGDGQWDILQLYYTCPGEES